MDLFGQLQSENKALALQAAKWKAKARETKAAARSQRETNLLLASEATETRRVAYEICAGGRVNANSAAHIPGYACADAHASPSPTKPSPTKPHQRGSPQRETLPALGGLRCAGLMAWRSRAAAHNPYTRFPPTS